MAKREHSSSSSRTHQDSGARGKRGAPAPGKVTRTSRLPSRPHGGGNAVVYRDAAGESSMESAQVGSVLDSVAARSMGQALAPGLRGSMEQSFETSFDDVRIHTDGAAGEAAGLLNANAFTVGSDVYFGENAYAPDTQSGTRLLAHELAHVVQGNAVAARASGAGPTVSAPGDAAEVAAERAADAVLRGDAVSGLGGPPASTVQRDALGDLDGATQGNWLGQVDAEDCLRRLREMSQAERNRLQTDSANHPTLERLARAFSRRQMTSLFHLIEMDVRWRIYWLIRGGHINSLSVEQWRFVVARASPSEMESLRQYEAGYRAFVRSAPADLVPPWDMIEGMRLGHRRANAQEMRNAVNQLNPEQKQRVRDSIPTIRFVVTNCGRAPDEVFRTVNYLDDRLHWAVHWLIHAGVLARLTSQQWSQLLAEAPRTEFDSLTTTFPDDWALVQRHCPPAIMAIVRQQTQAGATETSLDDAVQIDTLFASLGPAGFLAIVTQNPATVAASYAKIKAAGKVHPVLDGLPRGPRLGARTAQNLKQWFEDGGETDVPTLEKMLSVRFGLTVSGAGTMNHTGGSDPATLAPWTAQGLRMSWTVMERLPPSNVEQNSRLLHLLRNSGAGNGNAYFWGSDVVMGYTDDTELANMERRHARPNWDGPGVYQEGGQQREVRDPVTGDIITPASARVDMPVFNATLRHEIGHAVDRAMGITDSQMHQHYAGGWAKYDNYTAFVDAIIASGGGLGTPAAPRHGYPAADVAVYRQAMINACTNGVTFLDALRALPGKSAAVAPPDAGPVAAVWDLTRWTSASSGPWYSPSRWKTQGNLNFHRAYGDTRSLYSFRADIRQSRFVTMYQWRAPGEWFAEIYQVYYAEQEQGPDTPVGGILRSKDPEAAAMMSNLVDRGYSPQDMRGGNVEQAPGTGR